MLEIRNTVTEVKNVFDGFFGRLDTAEEKLSQLKYISIGYSKIKK